MTKNEKKINSVVLINILSTILLNGITFFTAPLFSRMLGAQNYGVTSVYVTWVSMFSVCLSLQTGSTLYIAKNKFREEEQNSYQSSVLSLSLVSFLVCSLVIAAFGKRMSDLFQMTPTVIALMLIHAYGLFCVNFLNEKNTMEFQAEKNLLLSVSVSVATVVLSVLLINAFQKESNYLGRILAMASVYGAFGLMITIFFLRKGKTVYSKEFWSFCLPLSVPIIFHSLANLILAQCDKVMLQRMLSLRWVGIYSLTVGFSSIMLAIWGSLNNSWSPFFYKFARDNRFDEIRHHGRNYLELYSVLTIGFMLLAPEVFKLFASQEFWDGIPTIPVMVLGSYFVFLYSFPVNYEFYHGQTKATAVCTVLAAIVNVILNYILISRFSAFGAAFATMVAHGIQFMLHHIAAKRIRSSLRYPFALKFLLPYVVVTVLVAFWLIIAPGNWLIRWGMGLAVGTWELIRMAKRKSIF